MLPFNVWAQSLWETLYMVILSTAISYLIGLPLGLTLVVTDKNGIRPMPVLNTVLGIVTNILRSIPFLILAVMIYAIVTVVTLQPQISDSRQQAAALQADVASAQQANLALEQDIANVGTDEAVMKIARERLNLVEDGEMIFIDSDK